ncbi:MAG: LemA domain-containing protein, partial [Verrucomicrobiota bacterium]
MFAAELSPAGPVFLALGFILLLFGLNAGRKRRLLDDTPLSKTLGVFIGEVEVTGTCVTSTPVQAYLSERMCVLYDWSVEEEWQRWETETYTDKDGRTRTRRVLRSGWTNVAGSGHTQGFY